MLFFNHSTTPAFLLLAWCVVVNVLIVGQRSYSTLGPVSTWMGDHLRTGEPSRYVTSHRGQLSLAIHLWVGAVSTLKSWGYTSPVSMVSQCKLVSG